MARSQWANNLKRKYGITLEQYWYLAAQQDFKCAICKEVPRKTPQHPRLVVDHDHKTGKFRGLLCGECNSGIGLLKDDITILASALDYLKNFTE